MRRVVLTALLLSSLAACSSGSEADSQATATVDRDTLTRRQKDSIIADMPIPQAGAVGKALGAADAAATRAERLEAEQGR